MQYRVCFVLWVMVFTSCGNKQVYNGDGMANYPNLPEILKENLLPYQKGAYMYQEVIYVNGKYDTNLLKAAQVDWNFYKNPFYEADIFKKEFDGKYKLDIVEDEYANSRKYIYSAVDLKAITKYVSVNVRSTDNAVMSVYAETSDLGFLQSKSYKLLFATTKSVQVQIRSKKPFSKERHEIRTLSFLN